MTNIASDFLYIIPARGGSKGILHKNIKALHGKPLIYYSIDIARALANDEHICVSTDDEEIIKVVTDYGLQIPFVRPKALASDTASTNDVLLHALQYYESIGRNYRAIVLLQPTSPLRLVENVQTAVKLYTDDIDMVVSVKLSSSAAVICEEDLDGFLTMTLNKDDVRRQDVKPYYEYNGAVYVINPISLKEKGLSHFSRVRKSIMEDINSIDIDTPVDWLIAEAILEKNLLKDLT